MSNETTYSPGEKPRAEVSELQKFTRCFTKDWRLHSGSFLQLAAQYIEQLPPDRKAVLTKEFRAFLYDSNADSDESLLQLWYAQGAEVWDFDVTIRPVMTDFYWLMNPDAPELEPPPAGKPIGAGVCVIGLKPRRKGSEE